jgi:hypothetical protein
LGDSSFDKGGVISAAMELILDSETAFCTENARPLGINFSFEVEYTLFIGYVAGGDEEGKTEPESESVDC